MARDRDMGLHALVLLGGVVGLTACILLPEQNSSTEEVITVQVMCIVVALAGAWTAASLVKTVTYEEPLASLMVGGLVGQGAGVIFGLWLRDRFYFAEPLEMAVAIYLFLLIIGLAPLAVRRAMKW